MSKPTSDFLRNQEFKARRKQLKQEWQLFDASIIATSDDIIEMSLRNLGDALKNVGTIEKKDKYGRTLLQTAVFSNKPKTVKCALNIGTNINTQDNEGQTTLMYLAEYFDGHTEDERKIISAVLNRFEEIDFNHRDKFGMTALEIAVAYNNVNVVKKIFEKMPQLVNEYDHSSSEKNKTLLMTACENGNVEMVRLFTENEKCSVINNRNNDGFDAMDIAVRVGNVAVFKSLWPHYFDHKSFTTESSRQHIIENFQERFLLNANFNPEVKAEIAESFAKFISGQEEDVVHEPSQPKDSPKKSDQPVVVADETNQLKTQPDVSIYQAAIANMRQMTHEGNEESILRQIRLLFDHGYAVDTVDFLGQTGLHFAVANSQPKIVKALLEMGADVNFKDKQGFTPLFQAIITQCDAVVDVLLKSDQIYYGVSPSNPAETEMLALEVAIDYNYVYGTRRLLEKAPFLVNNYAHDKGIDAEQTLLMKACISKKNEIAKLFINHPNAILDQLSHGLGYTALSYSIASGNVEMAELLIKKGCSAEIRDVGGRNNMDKAFEFAHENVLNAFWKRDLKYENFADNSKAEMQNAYERVKARMEQVFEENKNKANPSAERLSNMRKIFGSYDNFVTEQLAKRDYHDRLSRKDSPQEELATVTADLELIAQGKRRAEHAAGDCEKMFNLVTQHNLQVNSQQGWTALHFAARFGTIEQVRDLVAAGANVDEIVPNAKIGSVLRCAVRNKDYSNPIVGFLLSHEDLQLPVLKDGIFTTLEDKKFDRAATILKSERSITAITNSPNNTNKLFEEFVQQANKCDDSNKKAKSDIFKKAVTAVKESITKTNSPSKIKTAKKKPTVDLSAHAIRDSSSSSQSGNNSSSSSAAILEQPQSEEFAPTTATSVNSSDEFPELQDYETFMASGHQILPRDLFDDEDRKSPGLSPASASATAQVNNGLNNQK